MRTRELNYYGRKSSRGATTFGGDPRLSWVAGLPALRVVVLAALACGDSDAVVVSSACDAEGPTTIVRLAPDEVVARIWSLGDEHALFRSAPAASDEIAESRLRVATTCGDDARELGSGLEVLDVDDDILACAPAEGAILLLSPTGAAPARTLATAVACAVARRGDRRRRRRPGGRRRPRSRASVRRDVVFNGDDDDGPALLRVSVPR